MSDNWITRGLLGDVKRKLSEEDAFEHHIKRWFPISIAIGIVVGIVMSLFFILIYTLSVVVSWFHPLWGMLVGGLIILAMVYLRFENPNHNGIGYVIQTKHKQRPVPFSKIRKFFSSGVAIGSGLPVGKEGPSIIIGSSLACRIARFFKVEENQLHHAITVGSAAATGALFQAPFGSAVFATEVPYKEDADEPMLMSSFLASVVAAVTLNVIVTFISINIYPVKLDLFYIGEAFLELSILNTFLSLLLGGIIGFISLGLIRSYYLYRDRFLSKFQDLQKMSIGLFLMLAILVPTFIFWPEYSVTHGVHYFDVFRTLIESASVALIPILLVALVIQFLATTSIIAAGFPGGIFSPSLIIGALAGLTFAITLNITDIEALTAFTIIGMSAGHASTTKTPIASVLLVMEITGLPHLIIPIVIANITAYITSGHKSLYEGQIQSRDKVIIQKLAQYDQLEELYVRDVMTSRKNLLHTGLNVDLRELKQKILSTPKRTFPVLDNEEVVGIITLDDVNNALESTEFTTVREAMTKDAICLTQDLTLRDAMHIFIDKNLERCPVVDSKNNALGIVSVKDILRGHRAKRAPKEGILF